MTMVSNTRSAFVRYSIALSITALAWLARQELTQSGLRMANELLASTLASIGDCVIVTDADGRITFLNDEADRLTGWRSHDAIGRELANVFRITNELTGEGLESPVGKVLRFGTVVGLANHTVLQNRDGGATPIDDSAAPIRRRDGSIAGVVLVFRTVGARREAQITQARLAAIVESSSDAILSKD